MIITLHCYRSRLLVIMGIIPTPVIMRGNIFHVNHICEKINKMRFFLTSFIDKNQSPGNHCYLFSAINSATASNTGDRAPTHLSLT